MRNFKKYTLANLNKEMKVMFNRIQGSYDDKV